MLTQIPTLPHQLCLDERWLISRRAEVGLPLARARLLLELGCAGFGSPNEEQLLHPSCRRGLRLGLRARLWAGRLIALII